MFNIRNIGKTLVTRTQGTSKFCGRKLLLSKVCRLRRIAEIFLHAFKLSNESLMLSCCVWKISKKKNQMLKLSRAMHMLHFVDKTCTQVGVVCMFSH